MAHRSPARWLAPIALVAFVLALIVVVGSSDTGGGGSADEPAPNATTTVDGAAEENGGGEDEGSGGGDRKTYVVKLGDTPSQIADETGVPLDELERLNPDLDPQLMQPGDRIRLRK